MPGTYLPRGILPELDNLKFQNASQADIDAANFAQSSQQDIDSLASGLKIGPVGSPGTDTTPPSPAASTAVAMPQAPSIQAPTPQPLTMPSSTTGSAPTSSPAFSSPDITLPDTQSSGDQAVPFPPRAAAPASAQAGAGPSAGAPPSDPTSWEGKAYAAAVRAGHPNPSEFVEQIRQESGGDPNAGSPAGAQGIAQIIPSTAAAWGVDPLDPDASLNAAAQHMAEYYKKYGDSEHALAAYNMGEGNLQQYGPRGLPETNAYITRIQGATPKATPAPSGAATAQPSAMPTGQAPSDDISQAALDDPDKWALCGPVASIIAASRRGGNWTIAQAKKIAVENGLWDADQGMHGLATEVQLLKQMGVDATTGAADAGKLAADALAGNTPILSTAKHYFVLAGYDPDTQRFDTSTTGGVFRGGSRWLTLDQIEKLGGGIQGAAYLDNPSSPVSSVATQQQGGDQWPTTQTSSPLSGAVPSGTDGALTGGLGLQSAADTQMLRQPLQPTSGPDSGAGASSPDQSGTSTGTQFGAAPDQYPTWQDSQTEPAAQTTPSAPTDASGGAGAFQDDQTNSGWTPPLPKPGTLIPIQNPDGSVSTELSITVTEPGLNGGRATNIPTVWGGRRVSDQEAVDNAIQSGVQFPSFPSIKLAVQAARKRTNDLGTGAATSVGGARVPDTVINPAQPNLSPDLVNAATGVNRSLTNDLTGQQDQYRQPLSATAGPDTFPTDASSGGWNASAAPAPPTTGAGALPFPVSQVIPNEDPTAYGRAPQDASSGLPGGPPASPDAPAEVPPRWQARAPSFQDDQTESGYVTPGMAPGPAVPDMSGTSNPDPTQAPASPLKPLYDLGGNIIGYVHSGAQAVGNAVNEVGQGRGFADIYQGGVNAANAVAQSPVGQAIGQGVQAIEQSAPVQAADQYFAPGSPEATLNPGFATGYQVARGLPEGLPQVPGALHDAWNEAVQSVADDARATGARVGDAYNNASTGNGWGALANLGRAGGDAVLGAINAVSVPYALGAPALNAAAPRVRGTVPSVDLPGGYQTPAFDVGLGDVAANATMAPDAVHLARALGAGGVKLAQDINQLIQAGVRVTPDVVAALRNGTAVEQILNGAANTIDRGITNLQGNAARVAALDAERAGQEAAPAYGTLGTVPNPEPAPPKPAELKIPPKRLETLAKVGTSYVERFEPGRAGASGVATTAEGAARQQSAARDADISQRIIAAIQPDGAGATGRRSGPTGLPERGPVSDVRAGGPDASSAGVAQPRSTTTYGVLGSAPPEAGPAADTSRFYHGTSSAFEQANADKFSKDGLYGPGYYLTDNPEVASSYAADRNYGPGGITPLSNLRTARLQDDIAQAQRVLDNPRSSAEDRAWYTRRLADSQAELDRVTRQGPNVRPLDVPNDLNLLRADAPVGVANIQKIARQIDDPAMRQDFLDAGWDRQSNGDDVFGALTGLLGDSKRRANQVLAAAGYDGIKHEGGLIRPLADANGEPIRHTVNVIFPESLGKIRQSYSGDYGGATLGQAPSFPGQRPRGAGFFDRATPVLSQGLASAVSGGVGAATADQLGDPNDPNRRLKGFVAGAAVPFLAARGARSLARAAGRDIPEAEGALASIGHVPGKQLPTVAATPQQVAAEAARGAQRGEQLNREVKPPGSGVPGRVQAVTKMTDPLAAARWAEDLLTDEAKSPRLAENSPERATTQLRVNPTGIIKDRIDNELAPIVTEAAQKGLHNELPQYVSDVHERDILDEFYHRGYTESMDASQERIAKAQANGAPANVIARLQAKAQTDATAAGELAMRRRAGSNPDLSYEAIDARIKAQEDRLDKTGQLPDLQRLAQGVWDTAKTSLQNAVDAGRVEPQVAQDLMDTYPHYVPTVPISKLDAGGTSFGANGGGSTLVSASKTGPVHALEDVGSGSERLNPIVAIRNQIVSGERQNQQNRVFQAFAKLLDVAGQTGSSLVQGSVTRNPDLWNGERTLTGLVQGTPTSIRVPAPVANGIESMVHAGMGSDEAVNAYKKVIRWFSSQLTAGRASYAPLNLVRDAGDTMYNAMVKGGGVKALPGIMGPWMDEASKAVLDIARAQKNPRSLIGGGVGAAYGASLGDENTTPGERVRNAALGGLAGAVTLGANKNVPISSKAAQEFELRGGASGGISSNWKVGQRWYRDVMRDGGATIRNPADFARYMGDWAHDIANLQGAKGINERLDMVGRTAAMRNAERGGAGPTEAMIEGRNSSYDADRAGTVMRAINGVIPFTNATVQGAAQFTRAWRDHPLGVMATVATTLAPAMLAAEAWNRSDPERAKTYDNVPQYLKDSGIVIVPGGNAGSDTRGALPKYLWIPTEIATPFVVGLRSAMQNLDKVVPGLQPAAGRSDVDPNAGPAAQWGSVLNEALQIFNPVHGDTASAIASNFIPPPARAALEIGLNKDLYRGSTIQTPAADERASALSRGVSGGLNAVGRGASNLGLTGVGDMLQNAHPSQVEHIFQAAPAYNDIASGVSDQVAPSPYKQAEQGRLANAPFVGGIGARFVRDAGGANLERTQAGMMTPGLRRVLADARMHPGDIDLGVPSDYKNAPLTRAEQLRWQQALRPALNDELARVRDAREWEDPMQRAAAVKDAISKAKDRAALDSLGLTAADIRDRTDAEQRRQRQAVAR